VNALLTSSLATSPYSIASSDVDTCYGVIGDVIRIGQRILGISHTDTASVQDASKVEMQLLTFEEEATDKDILRFAEQSGHFAFLDESEEDIYRPDDGEPV